MSASATSAEHDARTRALGVVVIGRNEGERLRRCLDSLQGHAARVVYVDSGSTDGSQSLARARGVTLVELDMTRPFTAARARNAGFSALGERDAVRWVQFVDGDCEVLPGWLAQAAAYLEAHPAVAAVSGRLRERWPEASVYNHLCDLEWDTPVGEARHCGGNAMYRAAAFASAGGFREDLIAGEEPELCVRLRGAGWKIWRIEQDMALHDAAMTRFGQWWKRAVRSGYAFAEGAQLHGRTAERHWVAESLRAWFWGLALPLCVALAAAAGLTASLWLLLAYPLQLVRRMLQRRGLPWRERGLRSAFELLSRFAELRGQLLFLGDRLRRSRRGLFEYK